MYIAISNYDIIKKLQYLKSLFEHINLNVLKDNEQTLCKTI